MNKTLFMALRLLIICGIAALALGVVNALTAPEIVKLEEESKDTTLSSLLERGRVNSNRENIVKNSEVISSYYEILEAGEVIGYVLYLNAKGYGGPMKIMAAYTLGGRVINARLMANQETPGFGKNAEKAGYMDIFKRDIPKFKYELKNPDVVSGATITFMGISSSLQIGSDFVKGGLK